MASDRVTDPLVCECVCRPNIDVRGILPVELRRRYERCSKPVASELVGRKTSIGGHRKASTSVPIKRSTAAILGLSGPTGTGWCLAQRDSSLLGSVPPTYGRYGLAERSTFRSTITLIYATFAYQVDLNKWTVRNIAAVVREASGLIMLNYSRTESCKQLRMQL